MASTLLKSPVSPPLALRKGACFKSLPIRKPCSCQLPALRVDSLAEKALKGTAAAVLSVSLFTGQPALADLNKFEAAAGGEFGVGTAAQYGEAELSGKDFSGQVLLSCAGLITAEILRKVFLVMHAFCMLEARSLATRACMSAFLGGKKSCKDNALACRT